MLTQKFNFLAPTDPAMVIRTRATARDKFAGLTGHAYVAARQLNTPVQKVQTSAHVQTSTANQVKP